MLHRFLTSCLMGLALLLGGFAHAGDSTSFNPVSVPVVAKSAGGGVPVGTVIAWPVSRNPEDMDKWLECDGRSVNSAVYPELFAVVGGSVPDYRGYFMRGVGGNSAGIGQAQGDAIRNMTGELNRPKNSASFGVDVASGVFRGGVWEERIGAHGISGSGWCSVYFDASAQVPTANENRPVNRAVRYLIRAKP